MQYLYDEGQYLIGHDHTVDQLEACWFDPLYWRQRKAMINQAQGRGTAFFIEQAQQQWVLRHYQRGGLIRHLLSDYYLWTGLKKTRMYREFAMLSRLYDAGMLVSYPVAARVQKQGVFYQGDLITKRISGSQDLVSYLQTKTLDVCLWFRLGQRIAQLHQYGVAHPDLNARNILVVEEADIALVDFDPGFYRTKQENLPRLLRSLRKLKKYYPILAFTDADWLAVTEGYALGM